MEWFLKWALQPGAASVVALAVLYFFRDQLSAYLLKRTNFGWDKKLEELKSELESNRNEIATLRAQPLNAQTNRQANIDRRKLEAIDQLWSAVKSLHQLKSLVAFTAVLKWPQVAEIASKDKKVQEMFGALVPAGAAEKLPDHDGHAARPYVTPLAWALFEAYNMVIVYSYSQMAILRFGAPPEAISPPESLIPIITASLPEWEEQIQTSGHAYFPTVVVELEKRIIQELQRMLEGEDDDTAATKRAFRIQDLVEEHRREEEEAKADSISPAPQERRSEPVHRKAARARSRPV